jgi:hypothetical protein
MPDPGRTALMMSGYTIGTASGVRGNIEAGIVFACDFNQLSGS